MMLVIKSRKSLGYLPANDVDIPMFKHCCGAIEVSEIRQFIPVFNAHGIQVMLLDETGDQ